MIEADTDEMAKQNKTKFVNSVPQEFCAYNPNTLKGIWKMQQDPEFSEVRTRLLVDIQYQKLFMSTVEKKDPMLFKVF